MMNDLLIGRTAPLSVRSFRDDVLEEFENTATITGVVTIKSTGVAVGDPISVAYVADSDGDYQGMIPGTLALVDQTVYVVTVTAVVASVGRTLWREERKARYPRFDE